MDEVVIKTVDGYYFAGKMNDEPLFTLTKWKAWKVSKYNSEKLDDEKGYIEAHTGKECVVEQYED
jgi:hypothetical protein